MRHPRVTDPNKFRTVKASPVQAYKLHPGLGRPNMRHVEILKVSKEGIVTEILVHNRPVR